MFFSRYRLFQIESPLPLHIMLARGCQQASPDGAHCSQTATSHEPDTADMKSKPGRSHPIGLHETRKTVKANSKPGMNAGSASYGAAGVNVVGWRSVLTCFLSSTSYLALLRTTLCLRYMASMVRPSARWV